jgi:hypothetical protein
MLAKLWPFVTRRKYLRLVESTAGQIAQEMDRRRAAEKAADDLFDRFLEAVAEANTAIDLGEKAIEIGEERAMEICDLRAELAVADELAGILESQRDAAQERAAEADRDRKSLLFKIAAAKLKANRHAGEVAML